MIDLTNDEALKLHAAIEGLEGTLRALDMDVVIEGVLSDSMARAAFDDMSALVKVLNLAQSKRRPASTRTESDVFRGFGEPRQ